MSQRIRLATIARAKFIFVLYRSRSAVESNSAGSKENTLGYGGQPREKVHATHGMELMRMSPI